MGVWLPDSSSVVMDLHKQAAPRILRKNRRELMLRLGRAGWVVLTAVALIILLLAIPGYLARKPMGDLSNHLVYDPSWFMLAIHRLNLIGGILAVLLSYSLGAILFVKRSNDPMALYMAYYLVVHGVLFGGPVEMLEPFWPQAASVTSFILLPLISFPLTMVLLAIFPDGRFVPRWTHWLLPFTFLLVLFTGSLNPMSGQNFPGEIPTPVAYLGAGFVLGITLILIGAQVYRYRNVSTAMQRQQTKWVLYGFVVMIGLFVLSSIPWSIALSLPPGTRIPWWVPPMETAWFLAVAVVPVVLTISIMRYRLYDIDILINRTLVYSIMTLAVVGFYMLIVGGLGIVFQSKGNLIVSLIATGLVAVLFNPLRLRLQRWVNKLLYGERDEPLTVLRRLGQRLESSGAPEEILPAIVETVAQALKLPYAEIALKLGEEYENAAHYGKERPELRFFPIQYQRQTIGFFKVANRSYGDSLSGSDEGLLRQIARQAGPVASSVQLMRDLRQSRARLVTAREEERNRLRRDLHDGLGPVLASQGLKIAAVSHLLDVDTERAREILDELASQNEATVAEIRRLVYALRPPELDELGLVGVVSDYAAGLNDNAKQGTKYQVAVHTPKGRLPGLTDAVEVAVYRITAEALTNVTRHANAAQCTVSLNIKDGGHGKELVLVIEDDGEGFPSNGRAGVGLNSMRERAEEVGGELQVNSTPGEGTRVIASFPLEE